MLECFQRIHRHGFGGPASGGLTLARLELIRETKGIWYIVLFRGRLIYRGNTMENPWLSLPTRSPYVLQSDLASVEAFNARIPVGGLARFDVDDVVPEPYVGNVLTAPVIILQLNPGSCDEDIRAHANPHFRTALLNNLRHAPSPWPFYFLDPKSRDTHPGGRWWRGKLRQLTERLPVEQVAQRLAVVEWFPYKSARFKRGCRVASQEYGFWLVRRAIDRGALIVVSRAVRLWEKSVPELQSYARKLTLSSTQNVAVTPNNLKINGVKCPKAWDMVIDSLT